MPIRRLSPDVLDKVWGSKLTEPWLANNGSRKIGEIWFSAPEVLPVLVKFLFTSERLSVQVHPGDAYAQAHGLARGKTEMWHILRAAPDATIALGLREPVTRETLRQATLDGEIVSLLDWIPVRPGDTFFVPAGTIHAIGAGLAICEIQQFSDATYRLFDYQRQPERRLHLDDALAVARLEAGTGPELAAECPYFRAERLSVFGSAWCSPIGEPAIYLAIEGEGRIAGEPFRPGEAWLAEGGGAPFAIESRAAVFMVATAVSH